MTMTADEQLAFFKHDLGRLIPTAMLDQFKRHASRSNLAVLEAALRQVKAEADNRKKAPGQPLGAVHAAYHRHVAATAAIFPILFVFESAWRNFVGAVLVEIYGGHDWWHGVRDAVAQGVDEDKLPLVTTSGSSALTRTIAHVVRKAPDNANGLETTYSLTEIATLHDIGALVTHHWKDFSARMFWSPASAGPSRDTFMSLFDRVRVARNAAFHHQVVTERSRFLAAAERLLDMIDVHLGSRAQPIVAEQVPAPAYEIEIEPRHR